ncbi:MAG: hypothetical protein S0880_08560 [Actinomycetota bacterium]|nr:hypothetical protein [Actinomycetota bacterium]
MRRVVSPVLVLVAWTLFVWVGRVRNILADDALEGWGRVGRLALATSFVVLGAATLVALLSPSRRGRVLDALVIALASWTTLVWVVRGAGIVYADHDLGFKVVHVVLAVVSIAVSGWAVQSRRRSTPDGPVGHSGPAGGEPAGSGLR